MRAIGKRQSGFVGALALAVSVSFVPPVRAQDTSASRAAQRGQLAESILAAKERALGEAFNASMRASLKGRMEALSLEQLKALSDQGELANLPLALGSITSDLVYTPVTPCRVFDSRVSAGGPGPIPANTQRNVFVAGTVGFPAQGGAAGGCGVPVGATSAIINFVTVLPAGPGNIRAWAVANPQPAAPLAAIMNYGAVAGLPAIANGVAVPLCNPAATDCVLGDLRLQADTNSTDILGDVVGYFGPAIGGFVDLTTDQTVGGNKTFAAPIVGSVTGSAATVTGIVPISNGGTGSSAQNFVDLTTAQTVGGNKTLAGNLILGHSTATTGNILKGGTRFIHDSGLSGNTFVGEQSGNFTLTGIDNTALGRGTLSSTTSGASNTAVGDGALNRNTSGITNTATGRNALFYNTTGGFNTALGAGALQNNTTGSNNSASGRSALFTNTVGSGNTATGVTALTANLSGVGNTASGMGALTANTLGNSNTAVGQFALSVNSTGGFNTAVGMSALEGNATGSNNTAIGAGADVSTANLSNATVIGAGATVDASDKIRLGNASVSLIEGQVAYTFTSDRTKKENFRAVDALAVLEKLRGIEVTTWNYIGNDPKGFRHYGPMAQDFYAAFGRDDVGVIGTDTTINSGDITAVLMIGLKGLDAQVQKDQGTIAAQGAEIKAQAVEIASLKQQASRIAELEARLSSAMSLVKSFSQQSGMTKVSQVAGGQEER